MPCKLTDVYAPGFVRLWYCLQARGGDDLEFSECGQVSIGREPDWWAHSDRDIETVVGHRGFGPDYKNGVWQFYDPMVAWALDAGVAPGQPVLFHISTPKGYRSYEGEYDEEWDYEIVQRYPLPARNIARRWSRFLRKREAYRAMGKRYAAQSRQWIMRDTGAMYINVTHWFDINREHRDEYRCYVASTHRFGNPFFTHWVGGSWGYACTPKRETSWELMLKNACEQNPYLSPDVIRALPVRESR